MGDANNITLYATDWAGNTTNISFTLEYSVNANAPALTVIWPPDGTYISGSQFTLQGQVDNATVTASISGNTKFKVWWNGAACFGFKICRWSRRESDPDGHNAVGGEYQYHQSHCV